MSVLSQKNRRKHSIKSQEIKAAFDGVNLSIFPTLGELGIAMPQGEHIPEDFKRKLTEALLRYRGKNEDALELQAKKSLLTLLNANDPYQAIQNMVENGKNSEPSEKEISQAFEKRKIAYSTLYLRSTDEYVFMLNVLLFTEVTESQKKEIGPKELAMRVDFINENKHIMIDKKETVKEAAAEFQEKVKEQWKSLQQEVEKSKKFRTLVESSLKDEKKWGEIQTMLYEMKYPTHFLVAHSHLIPNEKFEKLLATLYASEGPNKINKPDDVGITPLALALQKGNKEVVKSLQKYLPQPAEQSVFTKILEKTKDFLGIKVLDKSVEDARSAQKKTKSARQDNPASSRFLSVLINKYLSPKNTQTASSLPSANASQPEAVKAAPAEKANQATVDPAPATLEPLDPIASTAGVLFSHSRASVSQGRLKDAKEENRDQKPAEKSTGHPGLK